MADSDKEVHVRVEAGKVCTSINSDATTLYVTHAIIIGHLRGFLVRSRMEVCVLVGITSQAEALYVNNASYIADTCLAISPSEVEPMVTR